jgi:hypothetical protein
MFDNSFKKYFTFIFLTMLFFNFTNCADDSIKKVPCSYKISDMNTMDDLYFADLMNHFEDYDYFDHYEWENYNEYIKEKGNIILHINGEVINETECQDNDNNFNKIPGLNEHRNQKLFKQIIEGINNLDYFYHNQEFYDL